MYCIQVLEAWIHIVFHPAVGVALVVSRNICDSDTIGNSSTRINALGHGLRTKRLKITAAVVSVADEHEL